MGGLCGWNLGIKKGEGIGEGRVFSVPRGGLGKVGRLFLML